MSMRLCSKSARFQTIMICVFRDAINKWLVIYLDDQLIPSNGQSEHVKHVELALKRVKET